MLPQQYRHTRARTNNMTRDKLDKLCRDTLKGLKQLEAAGYTIPHYSVVKKRLESYLSPTATKGSAKKRKPSTAKKRKPSTAKKKPTATPGEKNPTQKWTGY